MVPRMVDLLVPFVLLAGVGQAMCYSPRKTRLATAIADIAFGQPA